VKASDQKAVPLRGMSLALALNAPAIPYRTDTPVSVGHLALAMLVTALVLGALVGALVYVRRRGWGPGGLHANRQAIRLEGIELQASRRVSLLTTAHVVAYRGQTYLIVESVRGSTVAVTSLPVATPAAPGEAS
jgi:hypothetical protein